MANMSKQMSDLSTTTKMIGRRIFSPALSVFDEKTRILTALSQAF
jgi:hypothetical protein